MNARGAFSQKRTFERGRALALSNLVCFGRHTITSMLATAGCQFRDWTADYRLFSAGRFDAQPMFDVVRRNVIEQLGTTSPLVVAMDDTLLRKSGLRTPGVARRRDPLGPRFQPNFVLAQRALQLSVALPANGAIGPARMIPIDFHHAPTAKRPSKKARKADLDAYRQDQKALALSSVASRRLTALRASLDADPASCDRQLWVVADGGFTNGNVLRRLPDHTEFIGRIRADAKLSYLPSDTGQGAGRPRVYGDDAPTPEQLRTDDSIPWETASVHAAGKIQQFRYKRLDDLRWRAVGKRRLLSLIAIAPLGYRGPGRKLRYRKPAYLICTDPNLPTDKVIQAYVWRWDIEVNFRDEKTLLGVGEAQVRHERSVEAVPAMSVAAYALMLVAAAKHFGHAADAVGLPAPKWRRDKPRSRTCTQDLINALRSELWGRALGHPNFSHFAMLGAASANAQKRQPELASAVLYACA